MQENEKIFCSDQSTIAYYQQLQGSEIWTCTQDPAPEMSDITKNTLFNKYKEKVAEVGDGKQYLVHWISF